MPQDETPEQAFSLSHTIRQILADTTLADPSDITDALLDLIPVERYGAALREALPAFVSRQLATSRVATVPKTARGKVSQSAKVTGIREWWKQILDDRVHTGTEWKRLGDCTRQDLLNITQNLRDRAEHLLGKAHKYEKLAHAMDPYAAGTTVESLGRGVIEDVFGTLPV